MATAALTVSLTGPFSLQGKQAALALEWWAAQAGVVLRLKDDAGSASLAANAYRRWIEEEVDILLGPYGSALVRRVGISVAAAGVVLWNHGGSADDLARPLIASLPAPASTYLHRSVEMAAEAGLEEIVLVVGRGRFADAVASGASSAAIEAGLPITEVPMRAVARIGDMPPNRAFLVVGSFEEDVAVVRKLRRRVDAGLIACVGAGLREFGLRLGSAAEGVVGPVQWLPSTAIPEVGPSGAQFARVYQREYGATPDYVAAQAAAAGILAAEAHRRRLTPDDLLQWRTSTLLGRFQLDRSWRQVGHRTRTIRWEDGRQVPAG